MTSPFPSSAGTPAEGACCPDGSISRRALLRIAGVGMLSALASGCRLPTRQTDVVALPKRHSVQDGLLLVQSDVKLSRDHELIRELATLRDEIAGLLHLPPQRQKVVVYLFADELHYHQYMQAVYPQLPPRRAYFVGSSSELAVYTSWGENIREDLRHEYTHGLLHASLTTVPLWLDEGLAEYFEVVEPGPARLNGDYVQRLGLALHNQWRPDLDRLEGLESVGQMQRADYQEAWAWVHYMLHGGPETREVLIDYLNALRTNPQPGRLKTSLLAAVPDLENRFLIHVVTLNSTGRLLGAL